MLPCSCLFICLFIFISNLLSYLSYIYLFNYYYYYWRLFISHLNHVNQPIHGSQSWQPTNPAYHIPPFVFPPSTNQASISTRLSISMGQPRPFQIPGQTIHLINCDASWSPSRQYFLDFFLSWSIIDWIVFASGLDSRNGRILIM